MSRRPARAAVAELVDTHHGPFTDLTTFRTSEPEGAWWFSAVTLARTPVASLFRHDPIGAAGTSPDYDEAVDRASGEAIERYSALNFDPARTSLTLRESGAARWLPRCAAFEPCGIELKDHQLDVPLSHVPVESITTGGTVMLPASLVLLESSYLRGELQFTHPISTGHAFATDAATAVWRGFCEVVERDALMQTWWCRRRVTRIRTDEGELPWSLRRRLQLIGRSPVTVTLSRFGRIDAVVNCAADNGFHGTLLELSLTDQGASEQLVLNSIVPFLLVSAVFHIAWKDDRDGNEAANRSVVNVSSVAGLRVYADRGLAMFAASKAALNLLTRHLAAELKPYAVRANALCPSRFPDTVPTGRVVDAIRLFLASGRNGRSSS